MIAGHNITRLAAAAGVSEQTVRNWLAGQSIRETTRRHIERGARELGYDITKIPSATLRVGGDKVGELANITMIESPHAQQEAAIRAQRARGPMAPDQEPAPRETGERA